MTIRKMKTILNNRNYKPDNLMFTRVNRQDSRSSTYLHAAMSALFIALLVLVTGLTIIDYQEGTLFDEEQPTINLMLPPIY